MLIAPALWVLAAYSARAQEAQSLALSGHTDEVYAAAWLPEGRVVTAGVDRTIRIWDATSGDSLQTLEGHSDSVFALAVSPDGKWLASAGKDGAIKLRSVETLGTAEELAGHRGGVYHLAFSPDGSQLASCGEDDTRIFLWDVTERKSIKQLDAKDPDDQNRRRSIHCVAFSPDGKQLVSCGEDRTVRLWDVGAGKEARRFEGAEYSIYAEKDKKIVRTTKKAASELAVYTVAFSPDGKLIASGGLDKTIRVWDAASGKLTQTIGGHGDFVYDLRFSQDGTRLMSCGHTGHIILWNVSDANQLRRAKSPSFTFCAAGSPDLAKLVLACSDANAYVMDFPLVD